MIFEACVESVESAVAAQQGGAARIELCSALTEGGITPSAGLVRNVRSAVSVGLFVLIRPRAGGFVYSDAEFAVMREDILAAKRRNADGVVLGVLTADGSVDVERTGALVELAWPLQVTFHRAFDITPDMDAALEAVIGTGANRILTSGGMTSAQAGASNLARLRARAAGKIALLAGGGVRTENVHALIRESGVKEVHSSLQTGSTQVAPELSPSGRMTAQGAAPGIITAAQVRAFVEEMRRAGSAAKDSAH